MKRYRGGGTVRFLVVFSGRPSQRYEGQQGWFLRVSVRVGVSRSPELLAATHATS